MEFHYAFRYVSHDNHCICEGLPNPEADRKEKPSVPSRNRRRALGLAMFEILFCILHRRQLGVVQARGMFFKYSRRFSVIPPSPIEVKKLMENLVFLGLSFGKIDSKESCIVGSERRSFNRRMPRCSDNSCTINHATIKFRNFYGQN